MGDEPPRLGEAGAKAQPSERRTEVVTLLFTDVVGSTALKQQLGDRQGVQLLEQHHALIRQTLSEFEGAEEIVVAGDSFLVLFTVPSRGVQCALALQRRLARFNQNQPRQLADRMGLHMGEVLNQEPAVGQRNVHGMQVDTCARVMSLARAGQILMTRPVFDNARQSLKGEEIEGISGLEWLNHGRFELKGVEEPVEICEVRAAGAANLSPPTTAEKARRLESAEGEAVLGWRPAVGSAVPNTPWVLQEKLGEGGFGEVWAAWHPKLKERRVFKFSFRADRVRALKREMTLFRLLKEHVGEHPNIVRLHEVYLDTPPFYLEEEYVAGKDLRTWCETQGGLENVPLEARLEVVAQAAEGLQAAHDAGIIHRDIKPGNILISQAATAGSQPRAKLTDFGIGQVISEEVLKDMTRAGFTQTLLTPGSSNTGTQLYMAPELLAGEPASIRSDIYSMGVVLYQLLVGDFARPVTTDWQEAISDTLLADDLKHCFSGDPQDRFAGVGQLAKNLRALPERRAELKRREAERLASERAAYRRGIVRTAAVATLILAVVTLLALYALTQARRARMEAQRADLNALNEVNQRELAERSLYAADMILAFQALDVGNLGHSRELMRKYLPKAGRKDLRSWEWRYLWEQCQGDESFTLSSHSDGYFTVAAFSPDGRTVAAASKDKTVKIWEFESHRLVATLPHSDEVSGLAISPDGLLLATGCEDGTVRLWDAVTKQVIFSLTNAPDVSALLFSRDSKLLAWVDAHRAIVWDVATRRELVSYAGNFGVGWGWKTGIAFSPDKRYFAFGRKDGQIEVWDWENKSRKALLLGQEHAVLALAFSPDGKALVSGDAHAIVRIWEMSTGQDVVILTNHSVWVGSLAFSPDGKTLATASGDQTVKLWSTESWEETRTLKGHEFEVWSVAYSLDGRKLVTASKDNTIKVWDADAGGKRKVNGTCLDDTKLWNFSPNRKTLLRLYTNATFSLTDTATLRESERRSLQVATNLAGVAISNDRRFIALGCRDGSVKLLDPSTGREVSSFSAKSAPVWRLQFSPDGNTLAVLKGDLSLASDQRIELWDTSAVHLVNELETRPNRVGAEKFSPDSRRLAVAYIDGAVELWDLTMGSKTAVLAAQSDPITDLAYSDDSHTLATTGYDMHIKLWEVETGKQRAKMGGQMQAFHSLAFHSDGRRLAAGGGDGSVTLWDINSAEPRQVGKIKGHKGAVEHISFLPDGDTLVSRADDELRHELRVWHAPPFAEIDAAEKASRVVR